MSSQKKSRKQRRNSEFWRKQEGTFYAKGSNPHRYDKAAAKTKPEEQEDMRRELSKDVNHKFNDVSWYAKNEHILKDAASFSYNAPLGNQVPFSDIYTGVAMEGSYAIPGLYSMVVVPSYGIGENYQSSMNLCAQNIYTYVRYQNSGSKNYDANDLMLYLIAMDNAYMIWNWIKRAYGYARIYSQKNRYMPAAYAYADGFNIANLQSTLADTRARLNIAAAKLSSFCVPAVMPLLVRHSWMMSNIYKDSDNEKAQQYMFVPGYYYQYSETSESTGGSLQLMNLPAAGVPSTNTTTGNFNFNTVLNILDNMINALSASEDIGVMSGDILKAYGQGSLFKLSPVDEDYTVEPVYNEEVLNQIHNSTLVNAITGVDADTRAKFNITQNLSSNTPYLQFDPEFPEENLIQQGAFINMPWDDVTPANTMVGTRLTVLTKSAGSNTRKFAGIGSEWINQRYLIAFNSTGSLTHFQIGNDLVLGNEGATTMKILAYISNFDWHPLMPIIEEGTASNLFIGMLGDISNYTVIDEFNIQNLHLTAIMSEFNIPQIGSF